MCRYAIKSYKAHYVCFDCRKTFKQFPAEDLIVRDGLWEQYRRGFLEPNRHKAEEYRKENPDFVKRINTDYINKKHLCPQCSKEMANLGMDFKAPKINAVKEWTLVKGIYKLGHAFQTCGCDGPGFIPTNLEEYSAYLNMRKRQYENMLSLRKETQTSKDLEQYLDYWAAKLKAVTKELNKIKLTKMSKVI